MVDEIDIYHSAKLLIDQHGEDAPIFAAMQANWLHSMIRARKTLVFGTHLLNRIFD